MGHDIQVSHTMNLYVQSQYKDASYAERLGQREVVSIVDQFRIMFSNLTKHPREDTFWISRYSP